ncbi:Hypothetical protein HEAR0027 [Herminiimonas arsenicoxydans]|uniref:Uncharacterized protein n=1 Tax=Herminiimonas arsenicoxydans TaxID=204773 RepID=A4G176_HERAR|nr:Hypothetical protein HEAR0027 [Herminiimonas arsenicoxydans]
MCPDSIKKSGGKRAITKHAEQGFAKYPKLNQVTFMSHSSHATSLCKLLPDSVKYGRQPFLMTELYAAPMRIKPVEVPH